jgi:outer membrane protein TolC
MQWPVAACFLLFSLPATGQTETAVTLEDALREAHAANAKLPVSAFDVTIAQQKREEARAERWLKVALEGDFIYAPPSGYDPVLTNLGEFRSQIVARQPVYDGGARRRISTSRCVAGSPSSSKPPTRLKSAARESNG